MRNRKLHFVKFFEKILFGIIVAVVFYAFLVFFVFEPKVTFTKANTEFDLSRYYSFSGGNTDVGRRDFLWQFGVRCEEGPPKRKRMYISKRFDEKLEELNTLQKRIGCDLKRYSGCFLRVYTYAVTSLGMRHTASVIVHRDDIVGAYIQNTDTGKIFAVYEKY